MLKRRTFAALSVFVAALASLYAQQTRSIGPTLTALDYYEIQQLDARFCHGLDSAADNGYLFADVFTADGVYADQSGRSYKGRERLAALARQNPDERKSPTNISHYTTNMVLTPARGGAHGQVYVLIGTAARQGGGINATGLYQDDLAKTDDGWRIKRRTFVRSAPLG
jgi:hypothetical protein